MRKTLGALVAVAAAMSLIGVAWAGDVIEADSRSEAEVSADVTAATDDSTPTTVDDDTTSTTIDDNTTSTTIDDNTDVEATTSAATGLRTYVVPGVGQVTINIVVNAMVLVDVEAPGWEIDVEKAESDRVRIEFNKGEAEAEFEAELHHGTISIEIETG